MTGDDTVRQDRRRAFKTTELATELPGSDGVCLGCPVGPAVVPLAQSRHPDVNPGALGAGANFLSWLGATRSGRTTSREEALARVYQDAI